MTSVLQSATATLTMNKPLTMKTATLTSNSSKKTACSDNASDIGDAEYVDRNIPKMELLKLNYLSRSRNNLANTNDANVQLRNKKRAPTKQQLYQRSHSEGLLKVSELSKLSAATNGATKQKVSPATTTNVVQPTKTQPLPMPKPQTNPLKYTVYKKHNSCDQTAALSNEKLQYTNDDAIFKARRKYSMFEGRKRSTSDNIQFYFDSRSYEQHVDNKMYGILMANNFAANTKANSSSDTKGSVKRLAPAAPPSAYENKSNSWNFVKATKSLLNHTNISRMASGQKYMKNVPSKKISRDTSLVDLSRLGQIFRENRRASADDLLDGIRKPLGNNTKCRAACETVEDNKTASTSKKVKKLSTEFENKCLCECKPKSDSARKTSAPAKLFADINLNRLNDNCMRARRKLSYAAQSNNEASGEPPELPPKNGTRINRAKTLTNGHIPCDDQRMEAQFFLVDRKARSKSIPSEHGVALFGHSPSQCAASPNTCGYKNCTFVNCPMSSITSALSNVNQTVEKDKLASKTTINTNSDSINTNTGKKNKNNISITKIDTISNKSKLYLRTKDFNDDGDAASGNDTECIAKLKNIELTTNCIQLNNLKNLKNANTTYDVTGSTNGSTTIPIKFSPNQTNLNNSMKCKSVEKLDFNSTTTIETKKFNNIVSTETFSKNDDDNRVKIFIRNEPISATTVAPIYEMSSADSVASDYYESVTGDHHIDNNFTADCNNRTKLDSGNAIAPGKQVACNLTDFGITPKSNLLTSGDEMADNGTLDSDTSKAHLRNLFPSRLGCDGAIFWNDCYYYDEHASCTCKPNEYDKVRMKTCDFCTCNSKRDSGNSSGGVDDDDDLDDGFIESKQVACFFFCSLLFEFVEKLQQNFSTNQLNVRLVLSGLHAKWI